MRERVCVCLREDIKQTTKASLGFSVNATLLQPSIVELRKRGKNRQSAAAFTNVWLYFLIFSTNIYNLRTGF